MNKLILKSDQFALIGRAGSQRKTEGSISLIGNGVVKSSNRAVYISYVRLGSTKALTWLTGAVKSSLVKILTLDHHLRYLNPFVIKMAKSNPANEQWPTLVELNSLSPEERRLEELEDEERPWLTSDAAAKVVVVVVPFVVIVVVIGIICGVRACRKAEKLRQFQERMKRIDVERSCLLFVRLMVLMRGI